jgi:hypothetical protein
MLLHHSSNSGLFMDPLVGYVKIIMYLYIVKGNILPNTETKWKTKYLIKKSNFLKLYSCKFALLNIPINFFLHFCDNSSCLCSEF